MDRGHNSRHPKAFSTEENIDLIEQLVCSQEEQHHTHLTPRKIAEQTENRNRRENRACSLRARFESNILMNEKMIWQDKKGFTLEFPANLPNDRVYGKGKKSNISDKNLLSLANKILKKSHGIRFDFMVWCNQTFFFVNNNAIEVSKKSYC